MCTQLGLEQDTLGHNAPSGTADNEKKALDKSKLWTLSNMQHARSSLTNKKRRRTTALWKTRTLVANSLHKYITKSKQPQP